jgi:hypothetical protein
MGPGLIETHTDNDKALRGLLLELLKICIYSVFVVERFPFDVKQDVELPGGRGKYFGVLVLTCFDVV